MVPGSVSTRSGPARLTATRNLSATSVDYAYLRRDLLTLSALTPAMIMLVVVSFAVLG